jgi:hypothetical protein
MPIATVVGLNGTVVTLTWTTASNAAVAQAALKNITDAVTVASPTMEEVEYTGNSTLPALSNSTIQGVVLAEGAGTAAHAAIQMGGNYVVGISNDTSASPAAQGWVVPFTAGTGSNPQDTIFVGGGGGDVVNMGSNTQLFFAGKDTTAPQSLEEVGVGSTSPSAAVWADGNLTVDGSVGSTTIHLDTLAANSAVFASTIRIANNGNGNNFLDIASNNSTGAVNEDILVVSGNSTTPAHVNLGGSAASGTVPATDPQASLLMYNVGNGSAIIDPGNASWLLVGVGALGTDTVFAGTGKGDIDAGAGGLIQGGSGGGNLMFGSEFVATTMVGGGNGDVMATILKAGVMQAGIGAETLASFASGSTFEGFVGVSSVAQTTMIGEVSGNTFGVGKGNTSIQANGIGGNTYEESIPGRAADSTTISGFNTGSDTVSLNNPNSGGATYTTIAGSTAGANQIAVAVTGGNTVLNFGDGSQWTLLGVTSGVNFH